MNASLSSWVVLALALALANLPFVTENLFGVIPLKRAKHAWLRIFELLVLYFVVGAVAFALEARIGNVFAQKWEFYAITACLFIVLSFPGFILRYLRKGRH